MYSWIILLGLMPVVLTITPSMAGKCIWGQVYDGVTLAGGVHAGIYKESGTVSSMFECQRRCCDAPTCDVALMLSGVCYTVSCHDAKGCGMEPSRKTNMLSSVSYITRWNEEGVKRTVFLEASSGLQMTCNPMLLLRQVTLTGGLTSGEFTDLGRVTSMENCYESCCQRPDCDLAFMLAQNCFNVRCADKSHCATIPAQPSIFDPQLAYVTSRQVAGSIRPQIPDNTPVAVALNRPDLLQTAADMSSNVVDNFPPPFGVQAMHNGAAPNQMSLLEGMPDNPISMAWGPTPDTVFDMQGGEMQRLPPPALKESLPGSNSVVAAPSKCPITRIFAKASLKGDLRAGEIIEEAHALDTNACRQKCCDRAGCHVAMFNNQKCYSVRCYNVELCKIAYGNPDPRSTIQYVRQVGNNEFLPEDQATAAKVNMRSTIAQVQVVSVNPMVSGRSSVGRSSACNSSPVLLNTTLKAGRKSGIFQDHGSVTSIQHCVDLCCNQSDCHVALTLGNSCYGITCKNKDTCATVPSTNSKYDSKIVFVRQPPESKAATSPAAKPSGAGMAAGSDPANVSRPSAQSASARCHDAEKANGKELTKGRKAGRWRAASEVNNAGGCLERCCHDDKCDIMVFSGASCHLVECAAQSECSLRSADVVEKDTQVYIMKRLHSKPEDVASPSQNDQESEYQMQQPQAAFAREQPSSCQDVDTLQNHSFRGGSRLATLVELGSVKEMNKCVGMCCERPDCDAAYLRNGHCFSVLCHDVSQCREATVPSKIGETAHIAFMAKVTSANSTQDWKVVYIVLGVLCVIFLVGSVVWGVCSLQKRKRMIQSQRLLEEDDEDRLEHLISRPSHTRFRSPRNY